MLNFKRFHRIACRLKSLYGFVGLNTSLTMVKHFDDVGRNLFSMDALIWLMALLGLC
jgi:hypothetical protein